MFPRDLTFGAKFIPCLTTETLHQPSVKNNDIAKHNNYLYRSESRQHVDGHRNYFPSGGSPLNPRNSGRGRVFIVIAIVVVLIIAGLVALWRWLA